MSWAYIGGAVAGSLVSAAFSETPQTFGGGMNLGSMNIPDEIMSQAVGSSVPESGLAPPPPPQPTPPPQQAPQPLNPQQQSDLDELLAQFGRLMPTQQPA